MKHWWEDYPWRMIQTNFREIDMQDINAVEYANQLKEMGATVVNLNAAGIIANYETKFPFQSRNRFLQGDSLYKIVDECHKRDMKVIARTDFSRVTYALYKQHPEWAARNQHNEIINYNGYVTVCVNSDYQQKYMFDILEELFTTHPFDGVFCNMSGFRMMDYSGNYYGPCHCENCKQKFEERFGMELPSSEDYQDPSYQSYTNFKDICCAEHLNKLVKVVKSINPEIAVNGVDFKRSETNTEYGRTNWVYDASSNSRLFSDASHFRPSDNASVDFIGYRHRHISVSPALMELRQWQNLANSGCTSLYIMGRMDNHDDKSCFEPTKRVFRFHQKHEALFAGLQNDAEVMLLRPANWKARDPESHGWIRALTGSHIPFDEMQVSNLSKEALIGKKILIIGDLHMLPLETAAIIDGFAKQGGTVIATGETGLSFRDDKISGRFPLQCLGISAVKEIRRDLMSTMFKITDGEKEEFPRCMQTPFITPGDTVVFAQPDMNAKPYLKMISEHPFGPPECCYFTDMADQAGLICCQYGMGKGIYIPWKPGKLYEEEGYQNTLTFMQDVLFRHGNTVDIAPRLTPMVELTLSKKDGYRVVQLINTTGVMANSYFEPVPVRDIEVKLPDVKFTKISTLNGGRVTCHKKDGEIHLHIDELKEYEAIVIAI